MCRILIYLGKQDVLAYDLLFAPDNSLINQSYAPKLMSHITNLAGFGMAAWSQNSYEPHIPFYYRTENLPFFDMNLLKLTKKIQANCLLAHVRGVSYSSDEIVVRQNAHPFLIEGYTLALAHNGTLADMARMKPLLLKEIKPEIAYTINGTTDSEWIYSLLMSQFDDPTADISMDDARVALVKTFKILRETREKLGIYKASPVNIFVTNGNYLIVTRFVFDYGCNTDDVKEAFLEYHSLWFTYGEVYGFFDGTYKMVGSAKRQNIIFASEPLTDDKTTWIEVPEYSLVTAWFEGETIRVCTSDLNV